LRFWYTSYAREIKLGDRDEFGMTAVRYGMRVVREMADFERGIKAGAITGAIYLAIALGLGYALPQYGGSAFWAATGLMPLGFGGQLVRGIVFGVVFAALYDFLPGRTAIVKGVLLSLLLWILTVAEMTYVNLSPPWQFASVLGNGTYYGGAMYLASASFALISIASALLFGVVTALFWNRFRGKERKEGRRGGAVLLVGFGLGAATWAVVSGLYTRLMVITGAPFMQLPFTPLAYNIFRTLVLVIGLVGWVLAFTAWRKTRTGKSGYRWAMIGGILMAVTGLMLLPGVLSIAGGVLSRDTAVEAVEVRRETQTSTPA
jgi:hypothetical protein